MTDENPLLLAVEALTKPIRRKVIQDGPVGSGLEGQKTVTIEHPPLIKQLEESIAGAIGIGGSGSLASERNMIDGDALYRFMIISATIKDWARRAGATITPLDLGKTLTAWYAKYTEYPKPPESERFYTKQLTSWQTQIEGKLDPPKTRDLPDACPVCGANEWWDPKTGDKYLRPLVIQYKPTGPDMIQDAKALCRACEQVWGVRELAWELEAAEGRHAQTNGIETG